MGHRWSPFALGVLAGIVAALLVLVLLQNREPQAFAAGPLQGADAGSGGLIMGVGSSQPNLNDLVWVLWKHPAPKHAPGADTKDQDSIIGSKDEFLTLCCYQMEGGGRGGLRLAAVRNITFDMDMHEYRNAKPSVMEIVSELQKAKPKPPK